jgi:hypothetical protein
MGAPKGIAKIKENHKLMRRKIYNYRLKLGSIDWWRMKPGAEWALLAEA